MAFNWLTDPDARRRQVAAGSASDDPSKPLTFVGRGEQERRAQYQADRQAAPPRPEYGMGALMSIEADAARKAGTAISGAVLDAGRGVGNWFEAGAPIMRGAEDQGWFGQSRIPSTPTTGRTATGRTTATPTATGRSAPSTAPTQTAPTSATESAFTGPTTPGGGRPSAVEGIYRREGQGGAPEFYNLGPGGRAPDPLSRGTVNYVPAGSLANMVTPQANVDAMRAAAARGDWSALERVGAIDRRAPVGGVMGGGAPRRAQDPYARSMALQEQAEDLYARAARTRNPSEKSPMLKQARALMGLAESAMATGAALAGQQSDLDKEAMKQGTEMQKALMGEPMTPADMAAVRKDLADAGWSEARSAEIMDKLRRGETESLLPFKISADDMQFLTMTLGPAGVREFGMKALGDAEFQKSISTLLAQAPLTEWQAAYNAGQVTSPATLELLNTVFGSVEKKAMGGYIEDKPRSAVGFASPVGFDSPVSFAEGGYVDDDLLMADPSLMDPMLMGDDMGAMDMVDAPMDGGMRGPDPLLEDYEQYTAVAERMGLPVIPFEQFAEIMMQAQQAQPSEPPTNMGAMGFAAGGPVPVSGKMVVDPDPAAATDSIPAMIDGQRPAALDSGEFVIPKHAVMFHGIDKLNKLIAQADQDGTGQGTASRN